MLISILIPVYNAERYLAAALDSVLAQTFADWECVCVNDGSTDGSADILARYEEKFKAAGRSLRIITKPNEGVSVARNVAMDAARGEYICFIDADDCVAPEWLANFSAAIRESPCDFVRIRRPWWTDAPGGIAAENVTRWMWQTVISEGFPWTYCVRREVALRASFPPGVAMSEDSIYLARLAPFVKSAWQLDTNGYEHLVHEDSAMFRKLASAERMKYLDAWKEVADSIRQTSDGLAPLQRERISHFVTDGIMAWLSRPRDTKNRCEIRSLWHGLRAAGCADTASVRPLFRVAYLAYAATGLLSPARAWAWAVGVLVKLKA